MNLGKLFNIRLLIAVALLFGGVVDSFAQECDEKENFLSRVTIKNNLLYDVLLTPNLGVEIALDEEYRYSAAANWMYAWWNSDSRKWFHRVNGGDLAFRRWFGKEGYENRFDGLHAGIYGQMLMYDFEWGKRGYIAEDFSYAAGIEGGYSLPVCKRLNIDFTIGFGYMWGEYKEYLPIDDCYVWQATKIRRWIGPTKAEVQLVWIIGGR